MPPAPAGPKVGALMLMTETETELECLLEQRADRSLGSGDHCRCGLIDGARHSGRRAIHRSSSVILMEDVVSHRQAAANPRLRGNESACRRLLFSTARQVAPMGVTIDARRRCRRPPCSAHRRGNHVDLD